MVKAGHERDDIETLLGGGEVLEVGDFDGDVGDGVQSLLGLPNGRRVGVDAGDVTRYRREPLHEEALTTADVEDVAVVACGDVEHPPVIGGVVIPVLIHGQRVCQRDSACGSASRSVGQPVPLWGGSPSNLALGSGHVFCWTSSSAGGARASASGETVIVCLRSSLNRNASSLSTAASCCCASGVPAADKRGNRTVVLTQSGVDTAVA